MSEGLYSLIYSSTATVPFDQESLNQLERAAMEHNGSVQITGYLTYRNDRFTQFLEGPAASVEPLMTRIRQDPRHTVDSETIFTARAARYFPKWSMRRLNPMWLPSGNCFDAIEEILHLPSENGENDALGPVLEKLIDELSKNERYLT